MSRTIRRKRAKRHHSSFIHGFINTVPDEWNGVRPMYGTIGAFPSIKMEGREYWKAYHWYHGDKPHNMNSYWYYIFDESRVRMRNKQELVRWLKDPDYEVMCWDLIDCADWDWY